MYGNYTAAFSALTLRAKWPLHRHLLLPDDAAEGKATACDLTSFVRGVLPSGRVLYGYYYLRQSVLLSWNPCGRYSRVAVVGVRGRRSERGCLCCCCCEEGGGDGEVTEVIGLLSGVGEECCGQGRSVCGGKVESCWAREVFGWEDGVDVRASGKVESLGDNDRKSRRNKFDSEYGLLPSSSFSEDLRRGESCRERVASDYRGESTGRRRGSRKMDKGALFKKTFGASSQGSLRKKVSDGVELGFSGGVEKNDHVEDSASRARQERMKEENRRLREEIERISRTFGAIEDVKEENIRLRKEIERLLDASEVKENIGEENRRLWEEASEKKENIWEENRRLRGEIERRMEVSEVKKNIREENRRLREEIERILKTFEINENIRKDSSFEKISEMKVENSEEMPALTASLLEEVTRQRWEINQLRENYETLLSRSEIRDTSVAKSPTSNVASSSRLEDRELISTSLTSLVEELRRQSMVIEQLSRSYYELAASSQIIKSDTGRVSRSEKVFISHLQDREKVSKSTVTLIGGEKDMHEDNSNKTYRSSKASISELSASGKSENSSQANLIGEVREQCRHSGQYREDFQETGPSELLVYDSNLTPISEYVLAARYRQDAQTAETSELRESDSKLASGLGKVSVLRQDDKIESTIFSDMMMIGDNREQHKYVEQLGTDHGKLLKLSEDNISMGRTSFYSSTSAVNITNLSSKQQPSNVDERIKDSLKYSGVPTIEETVSGSHGGQEGNSAVVLVQEVDKEKTKLLQETRSSGGISLTASASDDSNTIYTSAEAREGLDEQTRAETLFQIRHDTLESANRLDISTSQFVGNFVNTLKQEMEGLIDLDVSSGSSGIRVDETSSEADQSAGVEQGSFYVSEVCRQKYIKEELSQSSALPETKGSSDDIWDLKDPSKDPTLEDATQKESSEAPPDSVSIPSTSGNAIVKRSGKSLWSYIADIIRIGWRPRATSQTSTLQSGTRSSSNESMGSDAWFSGREQEEEVEQKKRRVPLKGLDPTKRTIAKEKSASQSGRSENKRASKKAEALVTLGNSAGVDNSKQSSLLTGSSESMEGEEMGQVILSVPQTGLLFMGTSGGVDVSNESSLTLGSKIRTEAETMGSISSVMQPVDLTMGSVSSALQAADLTAGGISSATQAADLTAGGISSATQAVDLTSGGISSATESVDSSALVDLPISLGVELELLGINKVTMPKLGNENMGKEPLEEDSLEMVETEAKNVDSRRRKFQRAKHVPREQFEEWEEARRLESEQRKTDEFFMWEALSEAKKAAESWEVPIGAVLVQDGKVIARGGNLVEELRDSTAHAEMICIREASNYLKSWRLSETTLYVTLEPCAMCAGAILQARIETVVWGAPNKLLGADGSWVRLFPGGDGGSSETPSQTIGPVHPFHLKISIRRGILETECADVMQQFFQLRRKKDKNEEQPQPSRTSISAYPTKFMTKMHNIFSMMFCL